MHITEEELFEILKQRYFLRVHGGNGKSHIDNTNAFAQALKAFVEKFTDNKNTIGPGSEKTVTLSGNENLTIHTANTKIKGEIYAN